MTEPIKDREYNKILATAQQSGDVREYRHLQGWRDIRNAETIRLYVAGKGISVVQAINHGAKAKDHLAALKGGFVKPEELIAAGVELQDLQRAEERQIRKLMRQIAAVKAATARIEADKPKVIAVIAGEPVVSGAVKPMTAHELQVAIAVQLSENAARDKVKREAKGKHGFEVALTEAERQAITKAHIPKPMVIK